MVTQWGMSDTLGPRTYGEHEDMVFLGRDFNENRNYSEARAEMIDKEIDQLISDALKTAMTLVEQNIDAMDRIANHLMEKEILEREEFSEIAGMPPKNPKSIYKPHEDDPISSQKKENENTVEEDVNKKEA